jgi:hypothetical protein
MSIITQDQQPLTIAKVATNCYRPIPHRWRIILDKHLAGMSAKQIAEETNYSLNSVYRVLNHKNTIALRQQLMDNEQQEFEALFSKVVTRVREGLEDLDPKVAAVYVNMWLRANGKLGEKQKGLTVNLTAEDVIMQIKNGTYEEQGRD